MGVVNGGNLHQSIHEVAVAAKPAAIPVKLEIDVSHLNIGQAVHVSDLQAASGRAGAAGPEDRSGLGGRAAGREGRGGPPRPPRPRARAAPAEGAAAAGRRRPPPLPAAGGKAAPAGKDDKKEVSRRPRCGWWSVWATRAPEYARSRHNLGFMVVDELRRTGGPSADWRSKLGAEIAEITPGLRAGPAVQAAWSS